MTTAEFNEQLQILKQGKESPQLLTLLRKMVCGFLRKVSYLDDAVIDDLLGAIVVRLLRLQAIPEGYTWNTWFWYAMRSTWAERCAQDNRPEVTLVAEAFEKSSNTLPVAVEVNARLVGEEVPVIVKKKSMRQAPQAVAVRQVWECAVNLLINYGAIQNDRLAALRFKVSQETARRVIVEAVLSVRSAFEALYRSGEFETIEACAAARRFAERIL